MSRKLYASAGWVLIVGAVIGGFLTIPVRNVHSSGTGGSMTVDSSPFATTVVGNGQFTYEAFWSVWWIAVVVCGLMLAGGVLLIRRWSRQAAPPALQNV